MPWAGSLWLFRPNFQNRVVWFVLWTMDTGQWTMDNGKWTIDYSCPVSTWRTTRSMSLSSSSGRYSFFRLARKVQAKTW